MAVERVTERADGTVVTERREDAPGYIERESAAGRGGLSGVLIGFAVLALVVVIAFFLMNANRNDALRTEAVSDAASSVASSAAGAANAVGDAASQAADSVAPTE